MDECCNADGNGGMKSSNFSSSENDETGEGAEGTTSSAATVNRVGNTPRKRRKDWKAIASENGNHKRLLRSHATKRKLRDEIVEGEENSANPGNDASECVVSGAQVATRELELDGNGEDKKATGHKEEPVMDEDTVKDSLAHFGKAEERSDATSRKGGNRISECKLNVGTAKSVDISEKATDEAQCSKEKSSDGFGMETIRTNGVHGADKSDQVSCPENQTNTASTGDRTSRGTVDDNNTDIGSDCTLDAATELRECVNMIDAKDQKIGARPSISVFRNKDVSVSARILRSSVARESRVSQRLKSDREVVVFEARVTRSAVARQKMDLVARDSDELASPTDHARAFETAEHTEVNHRKNQSSSSLQKSVVVCNSSDVLCDGSISESNNAEASDSDKEIQFEGRRTKQKPRAMDKHSDISERKFKQSICGKRNAAMSDGEPTSKKNRKYLQEEQCPEMRLSQLSEKSRRRSTPGRRLLEEETHVTEEEAPENPRRHSVRSYVRKGNAVRGYCRNNGSKSISAEEKVRKPVEICTSRADAGKGKGFEPSTSSEAKFPEKSYRASKMKSHQVKLSIMESPTGKKKSKKSSRANLPSLSSATNPHLALSERKQIIRDHIKAILLDHGWTIDFRRRNGRDYEDSVYIPPEGKGSHWSITKAYYTFLKDMANRQDMKKRKLIPSFTPIPEDLMLMLKKTMVKKRGSSKGKLKKLKTKKSQGRKYKTLSNRTSKEAISRSGKPRRRGYVLRVRGKDQKCCDDDYAPYEWKRTIFSWMIDLYVLSENAKLILKGKDCKRALAEGVVTRDGISCCCCNNVLSVTDFTSHAGSTPSQPYQHMYVEDLGLDLLHCLKTAWEKQFNSEKEAFCSITADGDDHSDDTCGICGDGGDLICCDNCPSTFHLNCLGLQVIPLDDWHCQRCLCKYCGEDTHSYPEENDRDTSVVICAQCNSRFHQACAPERTTDPCTSAQRRKSFCHKGCKQLFEGLQNILAVRNDLESGFSVMVVQRVDAELQVSSLDRMAECNAKVAVAHAIMDECFLPISDQRSGIDLIRNVVYNCGSNFDRLDFQGFYTFVLEKGDEIISVASVRVHGTRIAEMPFVGTRSMYRRQGMCRRLLVGIEAILRSLGVEKLIIPAISELVDTWTEIFGFRPLESSDKQELRSLTMLVFPGIGLLQKTIADAEKHEGASADLKDFKRQDPETLSEAPRQNGNNPDDSAAVPCGSYSGSPESKPSYHMASDDSFGHSNCALAGKSDSLPEDESKPSTVRSAVVQADGAAVLDNDEDKEEEDDEAGAIFDTSALGCASKCITGDVTFGQDSCATNVTGCS